MRETTVQRTLRLRESTAAALGKIDETSENAFIERAVRQELRRLGLLDPPAGRDEEVERLTEEVQRLREDIDELRSRTS